MAGNHGSASSSRANSATTTPRSARMKSRMSAIQAQKDARMQKRNTTPQRGTTTPRGATPPRGASSCGTGLTLELVEDPAPEPEEADRSALIEHLKSPKHIGVGVGPRGRVSPRASPLARQASLANHVAKPASAFATMMPSRSSRWKRAAFKVVISNTFGRADTVDDDVNYKRCFTTKRRNAIVDELNIINDSNRWELEVRWGTDSVFGARAEDVDADEEEHCVLSPAGILMHDLELHSKHKWWRSFRWTVCSFPFNLVFHFGKFGAEFGQNSKWSDRLQVFSSAFIWMFPIAFFMFALPEQPNEHTVTLLILAYIFYMMAPVGYIAFRDMIRSFKDNSIVMTAFLFRPSVFCRLTLDNLSASGGYFCEFLQHCQIACPSDYFGFRTEAKAINMTLWNATEPGQAPLPEQTLVDTLLQKYQEQYTLLFFGSVGIVIASNAVMMLRFTLQGRYNYKLRNGGIVSFLLWAYGMYFIHGPLYLTVQKFLFQSLACDYTTQPATLRANPEIECWDLNHRWMAACGLMGLGWYCITAILLPATSYLETTQPDLDIIFVPIYLQTVFFVKTVLLVVIIFFGHHDNIKVPTVFLLNALMLWLNSKMSPCCVHAVNICRSAAFASASWIGLVGVVYLYRIDQNNQAAESCAQAEVDIKNSSMQFIIAGMLCICINMVTSLLAKTKSAHHSAATTFVDFEHEDSGGGSMRHLEPFLALCTSECVDNNDVAVTYHSKLTKLLDNHPSQHVRFEAAWAIFVLCWHPENRHIFIDESLREADRKAASPRAALDVGAAAHEPLAVPTLLRQAVSGTLELQFKCLAACVNLSLVDGERRIDELLRYGMLKMATKTVYSEFKTATQFSTMAIANFARHAKCRPMILKSNLMPRLIKLLKSRNPLMQKAACAAVANMSCLKEVALMAIGEKGFLHQVLRIARKQNGETLTEVTMLLANLTCYDELVGTLNEHNAEQVLTLYKKTDVDASTKHAIMIALSNLQDPAEVQARVIARFKRAKSRINGVNSIMRMLRGKKQEAAVSPRRVGDRDNDTALDDNDPGASARMKEIRDRRKKVIRLWSKLRVWGRVAGGIQIGRRRRPNVLERSFATKSLEKLDLWPRLPRDWLLQIRGRLEVQRRMHKMINSARIKECKQGEMIFKQGEVAYSGYYNIIYKGQVLVIVDKKVTRRLNPGDAFGEVALTHQREQAKRTATVTAVGKVTLMVIDASVFRECVLNQRLDHYGNVVRKSETMLTQDELRTKEIKRQVKDLDDLRKRKPVTISSLVDWDAWGSKLDRFTVDNIMDLYTQDPELPQRTFVGPM